MHVKRMKSLIRGLKKRVNPQKFELIRWGNPECGYAGCAIGWGCTFPVLKRQGLRKHKYQNWPVFDVHEGWEAVTRFFEITHSEAYYLFTSSSYGCPDPDLEVVIKRLKKFVKEYIPPQSFVFNR